MEGRADFGGSYSMDEAILRTLEERLGSLYARQRLGIEADKFGSSTSTLTAGSSVSRDARMHPAVPPPTMT